MEFEIRVDPKNGKTGAEGYTAGYAPTMAWAWNFARAAIKATGCHVFIVRHHSAQRTAIILANNCDEAFAIQYLE